MENRLFEIRLAEEADRQQLAALVDRGSHKLFAKMDQDAEQMAAEQCRLFSERLGDPQSDVLVASTVYGLVGAVYVQNGGEMAKESGCDAFLGGLFSAVRGMGIGPRLNQEALLCAAGRGAGSVYAKLPRANKAAIRDLQDLGFRHLGENSTPSEERGLWARMEMSLMHGSIDPAGAAPSRRRPPPAA